MTGKQLICNKKIHKINDNCLRLMLAVAYISFLGVMIGYKIIKNIYNK